MQPMNDDARAAFLSALADAFDSAATRCPTKEAAAASILHDLRYRGWTFQRAGRLLHDGPAVTTLGCGGREVTNGTVEIVEKID